MQKVIDIQNGITRHPNYRMAEPVNFSVNDGECIAIVGPNGGGKSMLVDIITEKHPLLNKGVYFDFSPRKSKLASDNIKHLTFYDTYGTEQGGHYYQERWNQHDISHYPTVQDIIEQAIFNSLNRATIGHANNIELGKLENEIRSTAIQLLKLFHIDSLMSKKVVTLSSGEIRKLQIICALMSKPRVIIIDNPFIGLDVSARKQLTELFLTLKEQGEILIVLVLSKNDDMPDFVTHVVQVESMRVMPKLTLDSWKMQNKGCPTRILTKKYEEEILRLPYSQDYNISNEQAKKQIIEFNNVSIKYGERTILKDLSFNVLNGEHWALSGENGAGKSTLLSIVCADNLQSYSNSITLFGYKRGSGESIWDIKKYIGYVSPEMHRAYLRDYPAIDIVASGLRDSIGLYYKPKPSQREICLFWMDVFGISQYADQSFLKLSSGEQRLVLLARAFVKDPSLLILDEPLHGLDMINRRLVKDIIEVFCMRKNKTLIMVTHYENDLPSIIDHRIYLKKILN